MKRYLIIGLTILLATNAIVISGVVYNRVDVTSQSTLTERELPLPYNSSSDGENSGVALRIDWRIPSQIKSSDNNYGYRSISLDESEVEALGFNAALARNKKRDHTKALYWALEFDGELYKKEVAKLNDHYEEALDEFQILQKKEAENKKEAAYRRLQKEKLSNSRLFFLEASPNLSALQARHSDNNKVIFVKGLANIRYREKGDVYTLHLKELLVQEVLLSAELANQLSNIDKLPWDAIEPPRYRVEISWGNRLEPWVESLSLVD